MVSCLIILLPRAAIRTWSLSITFNQVFAYPIPKFFFPTFTSTFLLLFSHLVVEQIKIEHCIRVPFCNSRSLWAGCRSRSSIFHGITFSIIHFLIPHKQDSLLHLLPLLSLISQKGISMPSFPSANTELIWRLRGVLDFAFVWGLGKVSEQQQPVKKTRFKHDRLESLVFFCLSWAIKLNIDYGYQWLRKIWFVGWDYSLGMEMENLFSSPAHRTR